VGAGYCPATVPKSLLRAPAPSTTFGLSDEDRFCDEGVALVSCTGSVFTVVKGVDGPVLYVVSEFGVYHQILQNWHSLALHKFRVSI
jgi:hypothetical protein